jgi:hypothetical protein
MEGSWEKDDEESEGDGLLDDEQSFDSNGVKEDDSDVYGEEYGSEFAEEAPSGKPKKKVKDAMADFASYDDFAEMLEADDVETE